MATLTEVFRSAGYILNDSGKTNIESVHEKLLEGIETRQITFPNGRGFHISDKQMDELIKLEAVFRSKAELAKRKRLSETK